MELTEKAELAIQGDKEAFMNMIRAVQQNLYVIARSIVKNEEDCANTIQEAIVKAFSNVHRLKEPAYFKTWIIRILINECNRIIKKKKRVSPVPYDLRKTSYKGEYEQIELFEVIDGLDEQSPKYKGLVIPNTVEIAVDNILSSLFDQNMKKRSPHKRWRWAAVAVAFFFVLGAVSILTFPTFAEVLRSLFAKDNQLYRTDACTGIGIGD
ncbi:sigma factor [Paenibacillus ottowii]|uniref:sigma factor n=1 Tax=Paenibacillus ottowii TaxID=2315729 RepID=UPI001FCBCC05|nr:sigma factor [Paenibacillus ottowii]